MISFVDRMERKYERLSMFGVHKDLENNSDDEEKRRRDETVWNWWRVREAQLPAHWCTAEFMTTSLMDLWSDNVMVAMVWLVLPDHFLPFMYNKNYDKTRFLI